MLQRWCNRIVHLREGDILLGLVQGSTVYPLAPPSFGKDAVLAEGRYELARGQGPDRGLRRTAVVDDWSNDCA